MAPQVAKSSDVEQDRQQLIDEFVAEDGPKWAESFKPGTFGCHELLDRTSLIVNLLDQFVVSHPACIQSPDWYALAAKASVALNELYQRIGACHLEEGTSSAHNSSNNRTS